MQVTHPNIIATIILALVYIGIARLWYSKSLFGKVYASSCDMKKDASKEKECSSCCVSPAQQIITFIQAFVMAFILGYVVNAFQPQTLGEGVKIGFFAWLGFIAANELSAVIWCARPIKQYLVDIGFMLVVFAIWGAVFALWH